MSSGSVVPPRPTRRRLRVGPILWALIPALSFGLLAPIPFAHAAVRLQQRRLWAVTAAYAIGSVGWLVGAATPVGGWGDALFGTAAFTLMVVGTTHAFVLRGRVFAPPSPAVAAALAARERREEARAIATGDVALARELRIGHPELPREFDDGGLVDVNHVPAQVLVDRLGLSPAQAGQVVQARERLGGFAGPEELIAGSGLPETTVDALRERLVFVAVERATDTHDDRPDTARSEDGAGMPSTPSASEDSTVAREFGIGFVISLSGSFFAFVFTVLLLVSECGTGPCSDWHQRAAGVLLFVSPPLLVVCGAWFLVGAWTKRIAAKRMAVRVLWIGTATIWTVWLVMLIASP